ncbi:hypothetical protein CARUB_v10016684mg, partial [Capsella rubella]
MTRLFLLLAFSALMLLEAYRFTDETDRQALLEFKSQRVTCGRRHKRVTRLDLGGLQLGGVISPSIGNLSFLISLNLSDNSFGGTIPQELGNLLLNLRLYSNNLGDGVPSELGSLTRLVTLYLGRNNLQGKLPAWLGNLTSVRYLGFGGNNLQGGVPDSMARLTQLMHLELSTNNFSGVFPPVIYNISSLLWLNIFQNGFSGSLRPEFGNLLPKLQEIYMGNNDFTGAIPTSLANISNLQTFRMEYNNLTGSVPVSFGKLRNLKSLSFLGNYLGCHSSRDLEFLGALTNCTKLEELDVSGNRLEGDLPNSIANFSRKLISLHLGNNLISGTIPHDIGNLINLQTLTLAKNLLTGILPNSLGKLVDLGEVSFNSNKLSGEIPSSIGNITRLEQLYLSNNSFEGTIPPSLGNCSHLLDLRIGYNKLYGAIPKEVMQIPTLVYLSITGNYLTGVLPSDVGRLQNLLLLSLGKNNLSGQLPQALGKCFSMERLYLQGNSFDGDIPDIKGLVGVTRVDFSNNDLSGSIPGYFANFALLEYLNLSFNKFEGKVPTEGKFQNSTVVSVFGNKNLCGGIKEFQLKPCRAETRHSSHLRKVAIGVSVGVTSLLMLFIALVSLIWFRKRKKNQHTDNTVPSTLEIFHEKISYRDLRNATDGFSLSNMVGSGSFGTVFKALLPTENKIVAVKVLNLQRHGAMKSFMAECESLKDIRHRNLVKLLTACASVDFQGNEFRALIYEFMPNGSLDMWLHPREVEEIRRPLRSLTLLERINIAIDVASALDYLHVHSLEPIAHCDLKPSNVLLDDDLTAHVSDFGLSRLLFKFEKESFFNQLSSGGVRGTIGYAAPEYGIGG